MLDKQIGLYSITTNFFFTQEEDFISKEIAELNKFKQLSVKVELEKETERINSVNKLLEENESYIEFEKCAIQLRKLYLLRKGYKDNGVKSKKHINHEDYLENEAKIKELFDKKRELRKIVMLIPFEKIKLTQAYKDMKFINNELIILDERLNAEFEKNEKMKRCVTKELTSKQKIMNFDNSLFRTLKIEPDTFTLDIMVIRVFHYQVFKCLILNGFTLNNEKYIFWSSSAGQVRTKKCVFIKESILQENYNTMYCGLSLDKINKPRIKIVDGEEKIEIGCNKNKYLAYSSLNATGTDLWRDFNIDQVIVVDDFENVVRGVVDYIDHETYDKDNLWNIERKEMDITIPVMDGCGISLDYTGMFRAPWCKGLFVEFAFIKLIKEAKKKYKEEGNTEKWRQVGKVKDIYGKEYDLIKDGIRHIMTKSQFKMWKYYDNWDEYKDNFKKYGCEAGKGNQDYKTFKKTKLSYQPLQTLYDLTNEEISIMLAETNKNILELGDTKDHVLNVLNANIVTDYSNPFQKSLNRMPELIKDNYTRNIVRETKASLVNSARYGKIQIDGMYTFVLPDVYAFAEWLILHEDTPQGLLEDGEVSCRFFEDKEEIDMLRSPHLNFSHCINTNVRNEKTEKWYDSNSTYTSSKSLYSLELMCDWDGDTCLITRDKTLISVAKRIREKHQIVPLYYHLKKAKDDTINNETLYKGMIDAYSNGNIGEVSNSITKVWNNGHIGEKELKAIAYLTLWNNVVIDSAKTLWFPEKSVEMDEFLKQYTNNKLPYFFKYITDKNKKSEQLEGSNESTINRLDKMVLNPRSTISAKDCGVLDYTNMLKNKIIRTDSILAKMVIKQFNLINSRKSNYRDNDISNENDYTAISMREEMLNVYHNEEYITDVLVKHQYHDAKSVNKRSLWDMYGEIIYSNIEGSIPFNSKMCEVCGERFIASNNRAKYCVSCYEEINKKNALNRYLSNKKS